MKTTNPLRLAMTDALAPTGFARKGDSWFRTNEEVVEVVNLQKSQYGAQHYLNYALWLRALGEASFPKEEKCHIRMRAGNVMSSEAQLRALLDLESGISEPERRSDLVRLLVSEFLPFAESCRTVNGLRSLFEAGRLENALILGASMPVLGISPGS